MVFLSTWLTLIPSPLLVFQSPEGQSWEGPFFYGIKTYKRDVLNHLNWTHSLFQWNNIWYLVTINFVLYDVNIVNISLCAHRAADYCPIVASLSSQYYSWSTSDSSLQPSPIIIPLSSVTPWELSVGTAISEIKNKPLHYFFCLAATGGGRKPPGCHRLNHLLSCQVTLPQPRSLHSDHCSVMFSPGFNESREKTLHRIHF